MDAQQSLATRDTFDQPTVEELLKAQMQASAGWNYASGVGLAGLPEGTPIIIGIIAKITEQLTGIPVSTWIAQWAADPFVSNLNTVITDSLAAINQTSMNIQTFLGSLDFTDPDFDLGAAAATFIDIVLAPVNKIATLVGGFILASILPNFDASKITTGTFANAFVPGLVSLITALFGSGTIGAFILNAVLPGFDASQIISGLFSQAQISGLPADLAARPTLGTSGQLLSNGSFATDLSDWGLWAGNATSEPAYDGTQGHTANGSIKIIGTTTKVDNFTTQDAAKWAGFDAKTFVSGGLLFMKPASSASAAYLESSAGSVMETLVGSNVTVKLDTYVNDAASNYIEFGVFGAAGWLNFHLVDTTMQFNYNDGTDHFTTATFNATNDKWLRIRESGGTTYWETAPAGVDANTPGAWTTRRSIANVAGVNLDNLKAWFAASSSATTGTAGTQKFDNYFYQSPQKMAGAYHGMMAASEGQTFTVSAWANWSGLVAPSQAYLYAWSKDAEGNDLTINAESVAVGAPGSGGWTLYDFNYTAPATSTTIWVEVAGSSDNTVSFDDVLVVQTNTLDAQAVPTSILYGEEVVPGIPLIRDVIKNATDFFEGLGWSNNDLKETLENRSATIAAQASQLARLEADSNSSGVSGTWTYDDFSWAGTLAARAGWTTDFLINSAADGELIADGINAGPQRASTSAGSFEQMATANWTTTVTDHQKVSTPLANAFNYFNDGFGDSRELRFHHYLRVNAARTQWVRWQIRANPNTSFGLRVQLQYKNGGGVVNLGPEEVIGNLGQGVTIDSYAGGVGADRNFQIKADGLLLHSVDDGGSATAFGASNRYAGFGGGYSANNLFLLQKAFPFINHWILQDNTPAAVVGSMAQYTRTGTGQVTVSNGQNLLPTGFFDTTTRVSNDITADRTNNKFTVTKTGTYAIKAAIKAGSGWPNQVGLILFTGGGVSRSDGNDAARTFNGIGTSQLPRTVGGKWTLYMTEGQDLQLGYDSNGTATNAFTGEASGLQTYFSIAQSNWSLR